MQRVYGTIDDASLPRVDEAAIKEGLSRAQWIGKLIETALSDQNDEKGSELVQLRSELERRRQEIAHLKSTVVSMEEERNYLRNISMALTMKMPPAIVPSQEEARAKSWWQFWK